MARAGGEVYLVDQNGNGLPFISVDLLDPTTGVRITSPVYADLNSSATLTLPLTTDAVGRRQFYLDTGQWVRAVATVNGQQWSDDIPVGDPTASGTGGSGGPHTHPETDITSLVTDLNARERTANKNVANGYAGLDATGVVPVAEIPSHSHTEANVANLTADLAAKADAAATTAALATKSPTGHAHAGTDITSALVPTARLGTGSASGTTFLRGDQTWATPAGGAGAQSWQFAPEFQAPVANDSASNYISVTTSMTAFRAQRTGGSGATLDLQDNGVSVLSAPLSLTTTAMTTATLTTTPTSLVSTHILKVVITGLTGAVTNILTSVEGTR